jgi:hypothetical protein
MGAEGDDTGDDFWLDAGANDDWELGWTFSPYALETELVELKDYFEDFLED